MKPTTVVLLLCLAFGLFGCSPSQDSAQDAPVQQPEPTFVKTADPQAFLSGYLESLAGERFVPQTLLTEMEGATNLVRAHALIRAYHIIPFIEWYFSTDYLARLQQKVDAKVARMDYQLKILKVPEKDAAEVVLVNESDLLLHKKAVSAGTVEQQWEKLDDGSFAATLAVKEWRQTVRVIRDGEVWKIDAVK